MGTKLKKLMRREEIENIDEDVLLESLAELEHDQWMEWAKGVLESEAESLTEEISKERQERWQKLFVPYADLSEEDKEDDRKYARKVIARLKKLAK